MFPDRSRYRNRRKELFDSASSSSVRLYHGPTRTCRHFSIDHRYYKEGSHPAVYYPPDSPSSIPSIIETPDRANQQREIDPSKQIWGAA
jgi:hypothetical protein